MAARPGGDHVAEQRGREGRSVLGPKAIRAGADGLGRGGGAAASGLSLEKGKSPWPVGQVALRLGCRLAGRETTTTLVESPPGCTAERAAAAGAGFRSRCPHVATFPVLGAPLPATPSGPCETRYVLWSRPASLRARLETAVLFDACFSRRAHRNTALHRCQALRRFSSSPGVERLRNGHHQLVEP